MKNSRKSDGEDQARLLCHASPARDGKFLITTPSKEPAVVVYCDRLLATTA